MQLQMDPDVLAVAVFMQERLTADRLVPVSQAIAEIAPALWGRFERSEVRTLSLVAAQPSTSSTPAAAT